jgi:outer membrane receptor protein involved in Fe transport
MKMHVMRSALLAAVSVAATSTPAMSAGIEVVTVTAERRSENIQTVPIAVTALTGQQLKNAQVHDFNDLQQLAPSLLVSTGSGDTTGGLVRIRGVGTTGNNAGLEASVGVFVDGVYRNRSASVLEDLLAVDRVEVLRGPQGTLFGKNTTAGAISIVSTKPSQDFYADVTGMVGTLGTGRVMGEINDGVTDTLAMSAAGVWYTRNGFLTDVNDGHHSNSRNHYSLKGQALWTPISDVSVRIIADYTQKADSSSDAAFALYSTRTRDLQDVAQSPLSANFGKVFPQLVTIPAVGSATQPANFKAYKIATNFPRVSDVNDGGVSGQIDWTVNEDMLLTSITAYRDFKSLDTTDTDYTPVDFIRAENGRGELRNISEEVQLKGTWGPVEWLAGVFYDDETVKTLTPGTFGTDANLVWAHLLNPLGAVGAPGPGIAGQVNNCILGLPNIIPLCVANGLGGVHTPLFQPGDGVTWHFQTHGNSLSFFTHDTWNITDEISATMGLRYNHEAKHGTFDGGIPVWHAANAQIVACGTTDPYTASNALVGSFAIFCHRAPYDALVSEESLTGTGNVSWHPNDRLMFYASYSRGYKAPPFNMDPSWNTKPPAAPADVHSHCPPPSPSSSGGPAGVCNLPFAKAEYNDNFELGARTQFWDGKALVNVTLFHERFRDFQINTYNGLTFSVANFKHVFADGVEIESTLQPIDNLTLNDSLTYSYAKYGHDVPTVGFPTGAPTQLAGHLLTQAPVWTFNTGGEYTTPLGFWSSNGFINVNANYRSQYNTGSDLNVNKRQPGFVLVNGQFGIRTSDDKWEVGVWGRNIFNVHYNVVAFNTPVEQATGANSDRSAISVFPGDPATYGISLTTRFE